MTIWLCIGLLPIVGKWTFLFSPEMMNKESLTVMSKVIKLYSLGELHSMYLLKRWMSGPQFTDLLKQLLSVQEALNLHKHAPNCLKQKQSFVIEMEPEDHIERSDAASTRKRL